MPYWENYFMRKYSFISLIIFIFFTSCIKNKNRPIVGSWKPVGVILLKANDGIGELLHSKFIFYKSGDFCISSILGSTTGNYNYNEKENTLIIDEFDSPPGKFTLTWEKDTLLMTNKDGTIKLLRN